MGKNDSKWFKTTDLDKYSGLWIAVSNDKLIAKNKDPRPVLKKARATKEISQQL